MTEVNCLRQRVPDSLCCKPESTPRDRSMFSWTVGPAAGWQINVKFGCRHVLTRPKNYL